MKNKLHKFATRIVLSIALLTTAFPSVYAQIAELKLNIPAAGVTILNPSLEIGFASSSAITMDFIGAFSEENFMGTSYPLVLSMGVMGYRRYLQKNNDHCGFFVSGDAGYSTFRMNKNVIPFIANDHLSDTYDVGYAYLFGTTVGYKYLFNHRWSVEGSVSGGWQHTRHEGYDKHGNRRFELNSSGEWLLYKAAINIGYRLW